MFLNITLHTCGQLIILKTDIMDVDATSPKMCNRFDMLILGHIHLMVITKKLAESVSFVLLMQLFVSGILLCIMDKYIIFDILKKYETMKFLIE